MYVQIKCNGGMWETRLTIEQLGGILSLLDACTRIQMKWLVPPEGTCAGYELARFEGYREGCLEAFKMWMYGW